MNNRVFLTLFLAVATALRWWWQLARPLSAEESYLALCGFTPSIAFFDGPGGVPWLVALGISLVGAGGLGATFFWPVLAALASVAFYLLVSAMAGRREALGLAVMLNLLPAFNYAALHATCAMPLVLAALGTLLCAWHALEKDSAVWWIGAGLFAAGGLLFSYAAWILLPAVAATLLVSHRWRRRLARLDFWLAWLPLIAVSVMLLRWNQTHGWVHFIGGTWQTSMAWQASRIPSALLGAVSALSPLVFFAACGAWGAALERIRVSPKVKFVAAPALAALLIATSAALRGASAGTSGLMAASLTLPLMAWMPERFGRVTLRTFFAAVFLTAALWSALTLPRPDSQAFVDANVGQQIESLRAAQADPAGRPLFLVAENAPLAAALALALPDVSFASPGHPPVYTVESAAARSQFDLWPRYDQFVEAPVPAGASEADPFTEQDGANPFVGRSALYVTTQRPEELPQAVTAAFGEVKLVGEIPAPNGRILRAYLCSDYQTMPL